MAIPANLPRFFETLQTQYQDRPMLKYLSGQDVMELSAADFFTMVSKFSALLAARGLCGAHTGIMGANRPQWLAAFCAVCNCGGVAVLLSPDLTPPELAERAAQADLRGILYDDALEGIIQRADLPGDLCPLSMERPPETVSVAPPAADPAPEDNACILFTSGTTARSKAVVLSQGAMVAGVCHHVIPLPFTCQLAILPFHHIAGIASVLNTWYLNAEAALGEDFRYLNRYLTLLQPDYMLAVPSVLQAMMKKLRNGGPNGSLLGWNLRLLGSGGAQFQPNMIRFFNDRGIRILQSYGTTEAGGLGFDWEMTPECAHTIGKPCPEIETKLVDGELFLRSASMMTGYYKDPLATREVLIDGWYATGDLCRQDDAGYLHLLGRKKNLIILSNGENVSPEQIEAALSACSAIEEVMVGVENDRIAATVYTGEQADAENRHSIVRQFVDTYNRSVPIYRQVHILHFSDCPFAKTHIGKLIRRSVTGGKPHDHR